MPGLTGSFLLSSLTTLWFCWLGRLWVIYAMSKLGPFSLLWFPLWYCWLDSKWVILYLVQVEFILTVLTSTLVLVAWKSVSNFMLVAAGFLHTIHTFTVVLLAWQWVGYFMPDSFESHLTVPTPNLILLASQKVNDFLPGPAGLLIIFPPHWTSWLDSK